MTKHGRSEDRGCSSSGKHRKTGNDPRWKGSVPLMLELEDGQGKVCGLCPEHKTLTQESCHHMAGSSPYIYIYI